MRRISLSAWTRPRLALVCGALCALAGSAAADDDSHPPVEVSGFVGYHYFNPTTKVGRYEYNPQVDTSLDDSVALGIRAGYNFIPRLALEAELVVLPTSVHGHDQPGGARDANPTPVTGIAGRLSAVVHLTTGRVRLFVLGGGGTLSSVSSNSSVIQQDTDVMFHAGAGVKVDIRDHWGLRLDGKVLFPPGTQKPYFTEDYEVTLALFGEFGGAAKKPEPAPDKDGDGTPDDKDKCVDKAGPADNAGCPWPDGDGDGVADKDDKCPAEAGPKENGGCPDKDGDGDGVVDRLDKCPDKAGPKDNDGCPWTDGDGDGVPDKDDKCPAQAGPKENGGCPDTDGDNDGVVDRLDKCPTEAGPAGNHGCPVPAALAKFTGAIKGIEFASGKSEILPKSFPILDEAAKVLTEFKDAKLEIAGHTDNSGDPEKNRKLSQDRANAVEKYLIGKGIADDRLKPVGYGPDKPIADNKTLPGRAKNRRVEFTLITDAN